MVECARIDRLLIQIVYHLTIESISRQFRIHRNLQRSMKAENEPVNGKVKISNKVRVVEAPRHYNSFWNFSFNLYFEISHFTFFGEI